ncbi:MAG: hypothetical protein KZQ98_17840 [Candidatus Thiodiazotropha sp. (ex Lucinoma borealis)]|nr:hypothetical protein [Candidatus Thiodiazotropha sp. (ex Lucinoma borealis)]
MTPAEIAEKRLNEAGQNELNYVRVQDLDESTPTELPATWSPESVRSAMSRFVDAVEKHKYPDIDDLEVVSMLLSRALNVDMDNIKNRRGDIPKALGLVHKPHRDYDRRVMAIAFFNTVGDLWDDALSRNCSDIVSEKRAIELGIQAFFKIGVELSSDEAESLYMYGAQL